MREEREVNKNFFFFCTCELQCTSKVEKQRILLIASQLCASFMCSGAKK